MNRLTACIATAATAAAGLLRASAQAQDTPTGKRDRVLPLFTEQAAFTASLGPSTKLAHALTVDRAGQVPSRTGGDLAPGKARALLLSLNP